MSVPDSAMIIYHKLILGWRAAQLDGLERGLKSGTLHPNEAKMGLAREIVAIFYGIEAAETAQKRWDDVFRSGGGGIPDDIPEERLTEEERVLDILRRLDMVSSGKEAKRLIEQKGIRMNEELVTDAMLSVRPDMLPVVLQVGKRRFVRLVRE
jgi:tyrosyl-tRNA synthetase